ncbi:MAG: S41 family peptidase [Bacilli bacterium]|nr:S41 family peptidase [Bacilli bacterium]
MDNNEKLIDKKNILKSNFKLAEVVVIVLITAAIGIIIGYSVTNRFSDKTTDNLNSSDQNLKEFIDTYEDITTNYYKEIDKDKLISSAIDGMLSELDDPYSVYMDKETTSDFTDRLYGNYAGIGAEISMNENAEVIIYSTFSGSPAETAGLKFGDIISKVDGKSTKGLTSSEVSQLVKGIAGTKVNITYIRDGKENTVEITRGSIILDSVTYKIMETNNQKIGYINISIFAANTYTQFKNCIEELEKTGIDKIIIDVRNNSGGYLDSVTDMMNIFLEKDKIIYQLDEKGNKKQIKDTTKEKKNLNVMVLINEYSASASEILASAFQESYGATIVGINSYGKGTVQQTKDLSNGSMLKYTTQKWLTPKGNWINEIGVTPDVKQEQSEEYYINPTDENDLQLQKAIETFNK